MKTGSAKKNKVLYEELTPCEFRERMEKTPVAYLPLGTLEWHGEHLPLGADSIQPLEFFKELASEIGGIVLPPLFLGPDKIEIVEGIEYYGKDRGNYYNDPNFQYDRQILTGSAYWVSDEIFGSIIESILKQLKRQGFKILVAHGHGPSTHFVINHTSLWEEKFEMKIFHLWGSENDDWTGFMSDHAAMLETSVVMNYRPELVQMENLPADPEKWPLAIRGQDPRKYASAEKGEEIISIQKERIIHAIKAVLSINNDSNSGK